MTWADVFWGLLFTVALGVWARGVSNHNHRWHIYEWLFSSALVVLFLIAAVHLL